MKIQESAQVVLSQLAKCLAQLGDSAYQDPIILLSGASIGKHVRHILDMFVCLDRATSDGLVSYERRTRNITWENERQSALEQIFLLQSQLLPNNRSLTLETHYFDSPTVARAEVNSNSNDSTASSDPTIRTDGEMASTSNFNPENGTVLLETNYLRELAYCIEHAIHHMAIIKIALISTGYSYAWEEFGVAPSTTRFQKVVTSA